MQKLRRTHIAYRTYMLGGILLLVGGLVLAQLINVQLINREKWVKRLEKKAWRTEVIRANRGSILADDGSVLASSVPFFRFAIDPSTIHERDFPNLEDTLLHMSQQLAYHFGQDEFDPLYFKRKLGQALQDIRSGQDTLRFLFLFPYKHKFSYQEAKLAKTLPLLNRPQNRGGLILQQDNLQNNPRFYPYGDLARITLGLMDGANRGLKGIEFSFNQYLKGQDGVMRFQKLFRNAEMPLEVVDGKEAVDGLNVRSTLNMRLQDVVESALQDALDRHKAEEGVAILMEVETGHIKAMANLPEGYNMAVAQQLEPGSTFKIASVMAALEAGVQNPSDTIQTGNGVYPYHDREMRDEHAYYQLTFQEAFEKSSNIGVSRAIHDHYAEDPEAFLQGLERLGILEGSQCQLKGEPAPYIIRPQDPLWNATTLPWMAIGYNVQLTPLQILTFVNAIANEGKLIQPLLVSHIEKNSQVEQTFQPLVLRDQICSPNTLEQIRSMLEGVVERGTARGIASDKYRMAGKTGTARKLVDGEYRKEYNSSFVGYFPAENPQYSCFVLIKSPQKGGYYGGEVAAPVFREIADHLYATRIRTERDSLPAPQPRRRLPTPRRIAAQDAQVIYTHLELPTRRPAAGGFVGVRQQDSLVEFQAWNPASNSIPDVRGMSLKDALPLLESRRLRVTAEGVGRVVRQSLPPHSSLRNKHSIHLELEPLRQ